jgi:hypothetical protein
MRYSLAAVVFAFGGAATANVPPAFHSADAVVEEFEVCVWVHGKPTERPALIHGRARPGLPFSFERAANGNVHTLAGQLVRTREGNYSVKLDLGCRGSNLVTHIEATDMKWGRVLLDDSHDDFRVRITTGPAPGLRPKTR